MDKSFINNELNNFLRTSKELLAKGKFDLVPRRKNLMSLAEYGLSIQDVKDVIIELDLNNYFKEPKEDFERPGLIWEFKTQIQSDVFYIKLKVIEESRFQVLKCLSFHKSDFD